MLREPYVWLALPAFMVAACATTAETNDPSQGGFGNAISGVLGGQYDERIATRRAELDAERRRQMQLNAVLAPMLAERDQLAVEIRYAENRISDQAVRIDRLRQQINASQSATAEQRARLGELERDLSSARERAAALDAYSTTSASVEIDADLAQLGRDLDRLSSEFDQLAAGVG